MSTEKKFKPSRGMQFVFGGVAGMMATSIVQPVDLIKTRMQLSGEGKKSSVSTFSVAKNIIKQEGAKNLYKGLSAALFRQATYTTTRWGAYQTISDMLTVDDQPLPFLKKLFAGSMGGGIGAVVGTPAEVALIRMTSDGRLPVDQRRNYTNVFNALGRIIKEEGALTMWRGCQPTIIRAMVLNAAQLSVYSQAKQSLLATSMFNDNIWTHFVASLVSGFISTAVSIPIDITKTRIQTMKVVDGKPEYKGAVDCLTKIVRNEGVLSLWKGFTPYFFRLGPHTIFTFIFIEQMVKYYGLYKGKN